jgi:hypothetical protein
MQGSRETVGNHFLRVQMPEGGMPLLELVKIIEHGLNQYTDHIVGNFCRSDKRSANAKGLDVGFIVVHPGGNSGFPVLLIIGHQLVDGRTGGVHQMRRAGCQGFLCQGGRMPHQPEIGIQLIITNGGAGFSRFHAGRELQIAALPAHGLFHDFPGAPRAGAGVADIGANREFW